MTNSQGALYGNRLWRVQYYDAATGGNALGAALTGTVLVDHDGRWSITLTPPSEVVHATGEVWYELAIDSFPAPDGRLDAVDVFSDRVKVESVLFAQRAVATDVATTASFALAIAGGHGDTATTATVALDAQALGGIAPEGYATAETLATGLAGKSDATHSHYLQNLDGAVTDGQVPDAITISSSGAVDAGALKSGTVPSARLDLADSDVPDALTVSGGTVNNTPVGASTPSTGAFTTLAADTLDTGQGANELHAMDQDVRSSDVVVFARAELGQGQTLDQSMTQGEDDWGIIVGGGTGQSFQAGLSGALTQCVVRAFPQIGPGNISVSIWTGDTAGAGTQISSVETVYVGSSSSGPGEKYTLVFSSPAQVTAGQFYHIRIGATEPMFFETDSYHNYYANGCLLFSGGGGLWTSYGDRDLWFETYVLSGGDALVLNAPARIADLGDDPASVTQRLYNNGGALYWDGSQILTSGSVSSDKASIVNSGILAFDWADNEVADDLTVSSAGAVDAAALKSGTVPSARLSLTDSDIPDDITITENDTLASVSARGSSTTQTVIIDADHSGVDQAQTLTSGSPRLSNTQSSAQSFTAGVTGALKAVWVKGGYWGTATSMDVSVYSGSQPGAGSLLSSVENVALDTDGFSAPAEIQVAFGTPPQLTAGQQYHILMEPAGRIALLHSGDIYAGGSGWFDNGGWSELLEDYWFKTEMLALGDTLDLTGSVLLRDPGAPPSTTTARLYNNGGSLYWNGTRLDVPLETPVGGTLLMVGDGTTVSQDGMAIGASANGVYYGHAVGYRANAYTLGTAMGYRANGNSFSTAVGYGANAYGGWGGYHGAVAVGYGANAFASSGAVVGAVAIGKSANARHDNDTEDAVGAVAIGLYANAYNQGVAIGGSFAEFTNGVLMHAPQTNSKKTAAANEGVAVGYNSYADDYGVALGFRSRGTNSGTAVGYRANAGDLPYALAKGPYSRCMRYGEEWKGGDSIPDNSLNGMLIGYNHFGYGAVNFWGVTTNATPTEIYLGGSFGQRFVVQDDCGVNFTVQTVAVNVATGDTSVWQQSGGIKRREGANTTALVGSISSALSNTQGALTTAPALTADTANGSLKVNVTGASGQTVLWNVAVRYSEVRQ